MRSGLHFDGAGLAKDSLATGWVGRHNHVVGRVRYRNKLHATLIHVSQRVDFVPLFGCTRVASMKRHGAAIIAGVDD